MQGDDKARFCLTCHKNVYNLSGMSRNEAEALIQEKEGKLCVTFYQRDDGTLLTADCPVALRVVQRPFKWLVAGAALLMASGVALATGHYPAPGGPAPRSSPPPPNWRDVQPIKTIMDMVSPRPRVIQVMGKMAAPSPRARPAAPSGKTATLDG
jgi:hypothetical protein